MLFYEIESIGLSEFGTTGTHKGDKGAKVINDEDFGVVGMVVSETASDDLEKNDKK